MAMESGETIIHDSIMIINNVTHICQSPHYVSSKASYTFFHNPFQNYGSLLMLQLSFISLVTQIIDICLKPLGQSSIVSQIFGGIFLGPSFLGHHSSFASIFFPIRSSLVLETAATFGLTFFLFVIGVKMDPSTMLKPGRKALIIGLSAFLVTLILPTLFVFLLQQIVAMEPSLSSSLPLIAASQSLTGFPVVACLLTELKILNTDIGRLALSSSMFSDVLGISMTVIVLAFTENKNENSFTPVFAVLSSAALLGAIVYIIRPSIRWMLKRSQEGKSVRELHIITILVFVLVIDFSSEVIGQHYVFGPLVLGLVVPDGPPLGSAIVYKVETLITGFFYPTYLAVSGLKTNMFEISFPASLIVGGVVLFSSIVKIGAVMLPAKFLGMPTQEALVLGLILNAKGIIELMVYNLWRSSEVLNDQDFSLCVISVIVVTAIITPLIRLLYDPSKQYYSLVRSTIQHSKRESEFRILLCLHHQDTLPTAMNLLEVSHASEESHVVVIALILTELIGRTTPVLIAHQPHRPLQRTASSTSQILNALRHYEQHNVGSASVESFTSISHYETMHDDVCRVARDKRATIVILPFHKQRAIDGSIGTSNRSIQNLNLNVLEVAPCSVGILIDRGILSNQLSVMTTGAIYHIAVLFIGGPDDAESVAYGSRMAKHRCVDLTVIRFLLFGAENSKDRKRDSELISEYREANLGNEHFVIVEEVVKDGVGLAASIRKMVNCFDLMIVGRHHHHQSQILTGLGEWSECPELGIVGDLLASPDFGTSASVLVVQQQKMGGRAAGQNMKHTFHDREPLIHDVPHSIASKTSWSITLER